MADALYDVIVIGAGPSGIAASLALREASYNILTLEARDRVGGRAFTGKLPKSGLHVDCGAAWLHDSDDLENPLVQRARGQGAARLSICCDMGWGSMDIFDAGAEGKPFLQLNSGFPCVGYEPRDEQGPGMHRWKTALHTFDGQLAAGQALAEAITTHGLPDMSIAEALAPLRKACDARDNKHDVAVASDSRSDAPAGAAAQARAVEWLWGRVEEMQCTTMSEVSLASNDYWGEVDKTRDELMVGGYGAFVARQAATLPIQLNTPVTAIRYDADGVTVVAGSPAGGEVSFRARKAIVTVPLGVLKHGDVAFTPALPAEKQDAIERMGWGLMNKVVLQFPSRFWGPQTGSIGHISANLDSERFPWFLDLSPVYHVPSDASHIATSTPVSLPGDSHVTGPHVLLAMLTRGYAARCEAMSDDQVVGEAMDVLRSLYGADRVPEPIDFHVTRWGQEPYTRGSYSHFAPGCSPEVTCAALRATVGEVLVFAGEATGRKSWATVHGAWITGLEAAKTITSLLPPPAR